MSSGFGLEDQLLVGPDVEWAFEEAVPEPRQQYGLATFDPLVVVELVERIDDRLLVVGQRRHLGRRPVRTRPDPVGLKSEVRE